MKRGMSGPSILALAAIALLVGLFVGRNAGELVGAERTRMAAIEAGVAEYRADPKTGAVEFKFKAGKQ